MNATQAIGRALRRGILLCCAALPAWAAAAVAQEEVAVLAKGSGLYFETYLAFQKALGRPVTPIDLSRQKPKFPSDLKIAVAFGVRAAALKYPDGVRVIYALAPGYGHEGLPEGFTRISALPEPAKAVSTYKRLQPGLKKLAVFYSPPHFVPYLARLAPAAESAGLEIVRVPLYSPKELPAKLRLLQGSIDAFWLLPEPQLIDRTALAVLAEFSCGNKVPFYAPSSGLVALGASAALAPGNQETGEAAAAALRAAAAGEKLPDTIFPPNPALTLNREKAASCGLPLSFPPAEGVR